MEVRSVRRVGSVKVKVTLRNSEEPDRKEELEMVVDTGAIYSLVPRHILENIGIRALERRVFTLANGERIERGFGGALRLKTGEDMLQLYLERKKIIQR